MAKKKVTTDFSEEDLDDLLGPEPPPPPPKSKKVVKPSRAMEDIEGDVTVIDRTNKGQKTKAPTVKREPRQLKGEMVTFKNKAGQTIAGMGTLYFVVRMNGKLHYKEFSQVTILDDPEIK